MEQAAEKFDEWAIVEVFGHQKLAGRVTEQAIGGASFVRIDVPEFNGQPAFTRLYGAAAIYSITPVTEDLARKAAQYCRAEPVTVYIPPERTLAPGHPTSGQACEHGLFNCEVCRAREDHEDDDQDDDQPF